MSSEAEPLTPAEARVRVLLAELREESVPDGERVTRAVVRTARWQRPVRRALLSFGTTAGALATGLGTAVRAHLRR